MFLLCATVVSPIVYSFRLTSFLHAKEVVLYLCIGLAALVMFSRRQLSWRGFAAFLPLWVFLAGAILLRLLLFPCAVPADAIVETVRWALLLLGAAFAYDLLSQDAWRRRFTDAFLLSAVVIAGLGLIQYARLAPFLFPEFDHYDQRMYSVFGNQDLLGGYLAMAVPFSVYRLVNQPKSDKFSVAAFGILLAGLLLSGCRAAWFAALCGVLVAMPYKHLTLRGGARLGAMTLTLVLALALLAPQSTVERVAQLFGGNDQGLRARLWFWDGTLRMVRDVPLAGLGLGNYGYWSPRYLGEALHAPGGDHHFHNEAHTVHAHSEPLELGAETGIVGLLCWLWMGSRLVRRRAPEWGPLAALLIFSCFSFPLHSAPHAWAGLLMAGMVLARRGGKQFSDSAYRPSHTSAVAAYGSSALCIGLALFYGWALLLPSYRLRRAEEHHVAGQPALALYEKAVAHPWPQPAAYEEHAIALAEAGRGMEAIEEFRRALAGRDTGRIYLTLGALALDNGDKEPARRWLRECLARWPHNADAWRLLVRATAPGDHHEVLQQARRWLAPEVFEEVLAETPGL